MYHPVHKYITNAGRVRENKHDGESGGYNADSKLLPAVKGISLLLRWGQGGFRSREQGVEKL